VRIAIDGKTHIPTRVQVFARGASSPAFQVGFTSLSTSTPPASVFGFQPPPGATVKQGTAPRQQVPNHHQASGAAAPQVVGKGWTTVLVTHLPSSPAGTQAGTQAGTLAGVLKSLPTVSGSWGSGHLLQSALFSAVLTNDGRVAVGAVAPHLLYSALSGH
jgi:hypothetical protein